MKRAIAINAAALLLSTTAIATAQTGILETYKGEQAGDLYASEVIGMRVYANDVDWDTWDENYRAPAGAENDWEDIGEVDDIILSRDGEVRAVKLDIGGFLSMGEKDIAVAMDQIKLIQEDGDDDDFFLVVKTNRDNLSQLESYRYQGDREMTAAGTRRTQAHETSDRQTAAIDNRGRVMLPPPRVSREGYYVAEPAELTSDVLVGARVYGTEDEDIGEIDRLIMDEQGKVTEVVIDVGGFLGIGEHPVAVTFDELQILRTEDGRDWRVYIDANEETLENQPAYTRG